MGVVMLIRSNHSICSLEAKVPTFEKTKCQVTGVIYQATQGQGLTGQIHKNIATCQLFANLSYIVHCRNFNEPFLYADFQNVGGRPWLLNGSNDDCSSFLPTSSKFRTHQKVPCWELEEGSGGALVPMPIDRHGAPVFRCLRTQGETRVASSLNCASSVQMCLTLELPST
jgi:hypothetical protein